MSELIYQNFFIKAPVQMLGVSLPLNEFIKKDEEGNTVEGEYYTIPEYLATIGHTVDRYSTDGYFIKGFAFNFEGLKELEVKVSAFGLELGTSIWILSPVEVLEELAKVEWNGDANESTDSIL